MLVATSQLEEQNIKKCKKRKERVFETPKIDKKGAVEFLQVILTPRKALNYTEIIPSSVTS